MPDPNGSVSGDREGGLAGASSVVVVSHRRSGTHLTIDAVRNNVEPFKQEIRLSDPLTLDHLNRRSGRSVPLHTFVVDRPVIYKTHAHHDVGAFFDGSPEVVRFVSDLLGRAKVIYVYRDVRDVMVSLQDYVRRLDGTAGQQTIAEFLRMKNEFDADTYQGDLGRVHYWSRHVAGWLNRSGVHYVGFEELILDFDRTLREIAAFLGGRLSDPIVNTVRAPTPEYIRRSRVMRGAFDRLIKAWAGRRYTSVGFRTGEVGGYRQILDESDLEYIGSVAGSLMRELGYDQRDRLVAPGVYRRNQKR